MIVNLHIERLVLDGLPVGSHEGPLVQAAVSAELARLFAEGGGTQGFSGDRAVALVRAEPILRPEPRTETFGAQVGRAIHGAVGR